MSTDPIFKARDPLIGSRIDERYLVKSVLGRGGMGVVYEGIHEQLGRPVAIKVLGAGISGDPVAVQRFLREAQTASQLTHGNIVDVSDLGVLDDGRPYLVMARVQGMDLATLLQKHGPQTPRRTTELLYGVAAALDLVHAKGFVHRDVKPENLMHVVREDGSETVLLLDFGIVGLVSAQTARLTAEGTVFGTPAYLPPEVIQGAMPDRRADVYALATVAFELMCGRPPFVSDNPLRILPWKIMEDAPRMSAVCKLEFAPAVDTVIARGLTREPDARWPSAGEFIAALDQAVFAQEEAASLAEPRNRSAAMRRSAVGSGRRPSQQLPDAPESPQAATLDSQQLEALLHESLTPAPPVPPRPPPRAAQQAGTAVLDLRSPTLGSVEMRTSAIELPGRSRLSPLWLGIAAGVAIGTVILVGRFAFENGSVPPESPNAGTAPLAAAVPAPPVAATPPSPPAAAAELPPLAAIPTPAAPTPQPAPGSDSSSPRVRPPRTEARTSTKAPVSAATPIAASVKPAAGRPIMSASELVQAAARELIQGHLNAAIDLYAQATRLDPKNEAAFRGLGLANERLGNKPEAIRAFSRALVLAPDGQNAAMLRARLTKLQASQ